MHNMSWKFSNNSNFYFTSLKHTIKYETDIVHNILSFVLECLMSLYIACIQLSNYHLQLIIQWTLNKHFTWHLLILCSCMSFCCLTRMHEVFFLQGSSLPLSKSTSGHKQFINSGFPELSCNLVPGKILSCYHANNLK